MATSKYYDGNKLLSLRDINGDIPEIYMCVGNRTAGKTVYFNRLLVNKFKNKGEKFCLLYRYEKEIENCSEKFFKDINTLFFPDDIMIEKKMCSGIYHELFLNDVSCGYAIALNTADKVKKLSHLFSDVKRILFDEFMPETGSYCKDEVKKLLSIHTSIARGQGQQVKYLPLFMISNQVTILNPYYLALGISSRLRSNTKFLKGNGFVFESTYNENAANAQKQSGFNRAFASSPYIAYSAEGVYLKDTSAFIEKLSGRSIYILTIRCEGCDYAIREFPDLGLVYCDKRVDATYPIKISVTTDDHQINYVMLERNSYLITPLRNHFKHGCFRFKDAQCKDAILKTLSF